MEEFERHLLMGLRNLPWEPSFWVATLGFLSDLQSEGILTHK